MLLALILLILVSIAFAILTYYLYRKQRADLTILNRQRKMLEHALAEASEKESSLRAVFEHSNAGIFICTADEGKLTFANDILLDMLQVQADRYHEVSILSYIAEDDRQRVIDQLKKITEGEAGELRMDVLIEGEQDFQSWIDLSISPILVKDEVRLLIGIAVDNTNKKIYKQKLETTEVRFRQLVDNLDDVVGLIDRDGKILYYNKAGLDYHKQTAEEIYGKYFYDYYDPEDAEKIMEVIDAAFATRKIQSSILNIKLFEQHYVVQFIVIPYQEKDGTVKRVQTIGRNITEQTRMVKDLENANQRLELIMQGLPQVIYSALYKPNDESIVFDYLSPKIEELTGYSQDYFLSVPDHFNQIVVEEDLYDFKQVLKKVPVVDSFKSKLRIRRKSGEIITVVDHLKITQVDNYTLRVSGTVQKVNQAE